jgi:hypothetical protein
VKKPAPDSERCEAVTQGRWYGGTHRCPYRGEGSPRLCRVHRKAASRGTVFLEDGSIVKPQSTPEVKP